MRAAIGNSNEVTPSGLVMRHTAVPDFVSAPNFSHTNKYLPPALACVRSTNTLARLHSTFVASSPRPEISSMTSGVSPTHHVGGSTFVTIGELSAPAEANAATQHHAIETKATSTPRRARPHSPV